jgi:RNase P/RNase MRP subunit p29
MRLVVDSRQFEKDMHNIMQYSEGFLDGVQVGKTLFFKNLGAELSMVIKDFVDSNARQDPQMLHHIYEWYQVGKPGARLYDINYTFSNLGLSFMSTFSQSRSIQKGSTVPFYDKAKIMEQGTRVTIKPKKASVLRFEQDGQEIFVSGKVVVDNPGGDRVQGSFEKVFNSFFTSFMTQSFLRASGIQRYIEAPELYKKNMATGKRAGKVAGFSTGYRWIIGAAGGLE